MKWFLRDCQRILLYSGQTAVKVADPALWLSPAEMTRIYENTSLFFVLASGRSGTNFLARLLDQDPSATVPHEPVPEDLVFCNLFRDDKTRMRRYLRYRRRRILRLVAGSRTYGEVTPPLGRCAGLLREFFPRCRLVHLVRDGRDVVRSIMSRGIYHRYRDFLPGFNPRPPKDHPLGAEWNQVPRFEKACWLWTDWNVRIRRRVRDVVTLENLCSDYRYFHDRLTAPLGLEVGEEVWRRAVERPENVTKKYTAPEWPAWSEDWIRNFQEICGDLMRELGYGTEPEWQEMVRRAEATRAGS